MTAAVGSRWSINDSGTTFKVIVIAADGYATVLNEQPPVRPRRIKVASLRTTRSKTGYTELASVANPAAGRSSETGNP